MKPSKPKSLAILQANGKQFPKQAIDLLEIMHQLIASDIIEWDRHLGSFIARVKKPPGTILTADEVRGFTIQFFDLVGKQCKEIGWSIASGRVIDLQGAVGAKTPTAESIHTALWDLRQALYHELKARQFVMIDREKADFFERRSAFGVRVYFAFPSAREEIKLAGNCLALDLNTAAVFHLMRAAEFGMRALASHMKVRLKNKPLEHGGWSELIVQIEHKIKLRREKYDKGRKKNKKELEFLKFCRMMADELYKFKEIWRNNTMHSISSYNESEARGVFDRVRDFMQMLSKEVSEKP